MFDATKCKKCLKQIAGSIEYGIISENISEYLKAFKESFGLSKYEQILMLQSNSY